MKLILYASAILVACSCTGKGSGETRVLLTIKRDYSIPKGPETATLSVDCNVLAQSLNLNRGEGVIISDHNAGSTITPRYIDTDGDKAVNFIVFDYTFRSNEPVFAFHISSSRTKVVVIPGSFRPDKRFRAAILNPSHFSKERPWTISKRIVESTMLLYPDIRTFPIYAPRRWNYEYGFFLYGAYRLGQQANENKYLAYAQAWADDFIQPDGRFREGVYRMDEYKLDDIQPGRLVLALYEESRDPKYQAIADTLAVQLQRQPRTGDGGYWHKAVYPHQMWLDGIFMADVFTTQFAVDFDKPAMFDEATRQVTLMYNHTIDSATGLMRHGWDESRKSGWADVNGRSPEVWCRAMGWYAMALVDILDYLPRTYADRPRLIAILKSISSSILRYQDSSGLWYQVMDKGAQKGNWLETSGSAMFAYAFAKGNRLGFLDESYRVAAVHAVQSILNDYVFEDIDQNLHLVQTVKVGTLNTRDSDGSFGYYTSTERRIDDYKGLGALLFATVELKK